MRRLFDSLYARVLGVQVVLTLAILVIVGAFVQNEQNREIARHVGPLWVAALRHPVSPPAEVEVSALVSLVPGPPSEEARTMLLHPRFRALVQELEDTGIDVREVRTSGVGDQAVTWLEWADANGQVNWTGIRGGPLGLRTRERVQWGLVVGLGLTFAVAWWLSRRILQPLEVLTKSMDDFYADRRPPQAVAPGAPRELRQLAARFEQLASQRQALDAERRLMVAAISHDLRSPLGRIRMAAELLPNEQAARRDSIARNVRLLDRLLGSFIDLGRADEEALSQSVDLSALVAGLASEDVVVTTDLQSAGCCIIEPASEVALERALRNLVDNAFAHGRPPVEVHLQVQPSTAVLTVRDHGTGIPAADRETLLRPFTRGSSSRSVPGTGLGLAIVQRTVTRHGGDLELRDASPGLLVSIRLPRVRR